MYDIKFMNIAKNEEVILTITNGYNCFKPDFYRLDKQIKNARKNGFKIDEK